MKMRVRDSKFELLRIISMVLIVLHHVTVHSLTINPIIHTNYIYALLYGGGKVGVALFMLITGYFLIDRDINYKRLLSLEFQVLFYSILIYFGVSIYAGYTFINREMLNVFIPNITKVYWFYSGYFVVSLISPYVTRGLKKLSKNEYLELLIILFIILIVLPFLRVEGMNEIVCMLYYFIIGGFIKKYVNISKNRRIIFLITSVIVYCLMCLTVMLIPKYNISFLFLPVDRFFFAYLSSPFVFFCSCSLFIWFSSIKIKYSKLINKLGGISFAVYLVHDHFTSRSFLWNSLLKVDDPSNVAKTLFIFLISIIFVYIVTIILEKIRNLIFNLVLKIIRRINLSKKFKLKKV